MTDADHSNGLDGLVERIDARLAALGMKEGEASTAAFGHHKGITHLRKGGTKSPGLGTIQKLADVLDVSPAWLAGWSANSDTPAARQEARPAALGGLRFIGKAAAGTWLDDDMHVDVMRHKGPPIAANPKWPASAQFVVQIEGTSVNKVAPDGTLMACVDPRLVGLNPQTGDLVIVERYREDRAQTERTAKRLRLNGDVIELWPQSTDPAHKPIIFDPDEPSEGIEVRIIGIADRAVQEVEQARPWDEAEQD